MSHVIRQPMKRDLADNFYYHVIRVTFQMIFVDVSCGKTDVILARSLFFMRDKCDIFSSVLFVPGVFWNRFTPLAKDRMLAVWMIQRRC